jgi:hypothetical protein
MPEDRSIGDELPGDAELIEVHIPALRNLFNPIDPSPLTERDLDPKVEEFIVSWARSVRRDAAIALRVLVDDEAQTDTSASVPGAIRDYFGQQSSSSRRRLSQLFRVGRTSLVIGSAALVVALIVGSLVETAMGQSHLGQIIRETLSIGGWVAMWRPLEIFLYDWWPIRREIKLYSRLAQMPVQIQVKSP